MKIYLKKFGNILVSRQAGREAFAALQTQLKDLKDNDNLEIEFEGVVTFTPSWGDEFLSPLTRKYGARLILLNTENPSVKATLKLLEKIYKIEFTLQQ